MDPYIVNEDSNPVQLIQLLVALQVVLWGGVQEVDWDGLHFHSCLPKLLSYLPHLVRAPGQDSYIESFLSQIEG